LSQRPDNELMLRVQAGDLEAFSQLVERFQNIVYGMALSMLRRREDAEEAAQDAFLKVFRARASFDGTRNVEPWLLRIAGNACRDKLRRRRAATLPVVQTEEDLTVHLADPRHARSPLEQETQALQEALAQLSERLRLPLELKYLRGLTNQQIADVLSTSVSNVKVQVARAKDLLQSRLQQLGLAPAGFRASGSGHHAGSLDAGSPRQRDAESGPDGEFGLEAGA
jgi:RNA polymerase sigma-70 factor (ECF subfamily)